MDLSLQTLRSSGSVPQWSNRGCVQLVLNPKHKMQFWHPKHRWVESTEYIHNHRYGFSLKLLIGELTHETWGFRPHDDGKDECVEIARTHQPSPDIHPPERGTVSLTGRYKITQGSCYYLSSCSFHRCLATHAVAFLCRGEIEGDVTKIIHPVDSPILDDKRDSKTETDCWDIIADLIGDANLSIKNGC